VITPRRTRLVRVPDLHAFRQAVVDFACEGAPLDARDRLIIVPTRAAAAYLLRSIEDRHLATDAAVVLPDVVTQGELVARLGQRLRRCGAPLTGPEREVLAGVACRAAIDEGNGPPFRLRPGLIAEVVAFYDALRHNLKNVDAFERLALGALEPAAVHDRGAERLVRQTKFMVAAFRHFERLIEQTGRADEHAVRVTLMSEPALRPWRHVVIAVGDYASDRHGLVTAHWDLLARIPGLERIDLVVTEATVVGAFHERIHQLLPGIEEVHGSSGAVRPAPVLLAAAGGCVSHTARDREEEVAGFARWVRSEVRSTGTTFGLGRVALVVRRPLPYVYLAREVLRSARIPLQMFDALPLASEPFTAALDLVIACVSGNFARTPSIALLRSPHFRFGPDGERLTPHEVSGLDRALSDAGYLGDVAILERLVVTWRADEPRRSGIVRAAHVLLELARRLAPLQSAAPCADHLDALDHFLIDYAARQDDGDAVGSRIRRGRAAVLDALRRLREAYNQFDSRPVGFDDAVAVLKRWIDAHTFAPMTGNNGVHLVDADSARFGNFDAVQLAGLVDGEWPETPRRNIFYPPALLRELGWPSESDRLSGIRASFGDLLRLPASRLVVSSFALEDDTPVAGSALLDTVGSAGLEAREAAVSVARIFEHEALGLEPVDLSYPDAIAAAPAHRRAGGVRNQRGQTAARALPGYSLSGLERYQDCPFKFFAADVLKLEESPEDEPMLSPRARGRFVHEVFQRFFEAWDDRGLGTITVDRVDQARQMFQDVAEPLLARFSEAEALLERARLFGSAVSVGIVDVVLGLEASRPAPVQERWLEHRFDGAFSLGAAGGSTVAIRGVADRIDLLEGRRLRVIDYKSGYAPQPKRALQAPVYALCAQERLAERDGQPWQIDEASYVAFAGKRPLVRVVRPDSADASQVLAAARSRVVDIVAAIEGGEFPPRPYELRICNYCAYPSVCRKDYVGDE
jgi:RecB family exonuclease